MFLTHHIHQLLVVVVVLLTSHLLRIIFKSFLKARERAALAEQWGCKPAPFDVFSDKLGILNVLRILAADRNKRCPDHYVDRFVKNSERHGRVVSTVACRVLGQDAYITCEPKNIQAMLATQFSDYGL